MHESHRKLYVSGDSEGRCRDAGRWFSDWDGDQGTRGLVRTSFSLFLSSVDITWQLIRLPHRVVLSVHVLTRDQQSHENNIGYLNKDYETIRPPFDLKWE